MVREPARWARTGLRALDGDHPLRRRVPESCVTYPARRVHGAEVVFFHFGLAREMGLIPPTHRDRWTARLERAVLDTFALQIVNEHDEMRAVTIAPADRLPGRFMATRYLQLQHPGRTGRQSGDGRSVWNGVVRGGGVTWDVSSCGTGVTRLCPATAETGEYFRTGNWNADYGCGTANLREGFEAALMGETFHRNGIGTERTLAILRRPDGFAIVVRAARNLIRPSHLFVHLKQGNLRALGEVASLFVERQIANGAWPRLPHGEERWRFLADEAARTFGRVAATFEREYVFCWLDWDGDNILADGGIVDYGSVRQFGLYHREYRFDDGPRWSTTLPEQRRKARDIVRVFAQIREALITGRKPPLSSLRADPTLALFDETFAATRDRLLLRNAGFDERARRVLLERCAPAVRRYDRAHAHFERARAARGPRRVPDGITWNAVFSVRDLLRELPSRLLERGGDPLPAEEVVRIAASTYASRRDRRITSHRRRMARELQVAFLALVEAVARDREESVPCVLSEISDRSTRINAFARITGDAVAHAAARLVRERRRLSPSAMYAVVDRFARVQTRIPDPADDVGKRRIRDRWTRLVLDALLETVESHAHGH